MTSWQQFTAQAPEMAAFGTERFSSGVAYLGTLRPDGGPRVHPVTPILGSELYLFMEPTSPKGKDLLRDNRYALHCSVADVSGGEGEFYVRGTARLTSDSAVRELAIAAMSYTPQDRYILFVLSIDFAFMNTYTDEGAHPQRWTSAV